MERGGVSPGKPGGRGHGKKSFYSLQLYKYVFGSPSLNVRFFTLFFTGVFRVFIEDRPD